MHLSPCMFVLVTYWTWEVVALLFPSERIKIHIVHIWCLVCLSVVRVISQQTAIPSFSPLFFTFLFIGKEHLILIEDARMTPLLQRPEDKRVPWAAAGWISSHINGFSFDMTPSQLSNLWCQSEYLGTWSIRGLFQLIKKEVYWLLGQLLTVWTNRSLIRRTPQQGGKKYWHRQWSGKDLSPSSPSHFQEAMSSWSGLSWEIGGKFFHYVIQKTIKK